MTTCPSCRRHYVLYIKFGSICQQGSQLQNVFLNTGINLLRKGICDLVHGCHYATVLVHKVLLLSGTFLHSKYDYCIIAFRKYCSGCNHEQHTVEMLNKLVCVCVCVLVFIPVGGYSSDIFVCFH